MSNEVGTDEELHIAAWILARALELGDTIEGVIWMAEQLRSAKDLFPVSLKKLEQPGHNFEFQDYELHLPSKESLFEALQIRSHEILNGEDG